ncbi:MAG: hydrolase [Gemmatimonadaceae bacterium]
MHAQRIIERRYGPYLDDHSALVNLTSELTYTPAWWVPGAHLQTLWGKLARRSRPLAVRAERWATPDGDEVELQRLDAPSGTRPPRLVVLHGLEGTIRSHYLRGVMSAARARGWAADALIFRGCNGEVNRVPRMYHSGETSDLDFVVRRLVHEHPGQPVVLAGFSLGGNVLLKWLGENGDNLPSEVRAAAAVSVPFDLERGARKLERGFSRIYTHHFLRSLRQKALAKLARFPGLFDPIRLAQARSLFEFDDCVTSPLHGFAGASDYYTRSSSLQYIGGVHRPTLLLSSYDDPFLPPEVLYAVSVVARNNPDIAVEFWKYGGHVGFVSGHIPFAPAYYAEQRVVEFLEHNLSQ